MTNYESSMPITQASDPSAVEPRRSPAVGAIELFGLLTLGLMTAYFLAISWRKWPDPIIDVGAQWYDLWRMAHGARLYHDFAWNYGPLSVMFNASLFRLFGPGMMILVTANLVIYGLILSLAYVAFRMAWGPLAAFAASAVFISVFSFSRLCDVANYNFATPYAHESTHGILLMLATVFVVARWQARPSRRDAFLLGLCGGLAAVMKPEFMLAGGCLGLLALILRALRRQPISAAECGLILAGIALPTLLFAAWFARAESWKTAMIDASQAWWLVFFNKTNPDLLKQQFFSGFDHPWQNASIEAQAALSALTVIGAIWAAGWFVNRRWPLMARVGAALAALVLACGARLDKGWVEVGRCFPVLIAIILLLVLLRMARYWRQNDGDRAVMALALVVLAAVMMARMPLFARVYHFGFFQAAFAGMVIAAAILAEVPPWTGEGLWGQRLARCGCLLLIALGCLSIAAQSRANQAAQNQPIGSGADRFYGFDDATTRQVNWSLERLRSIAPGATLLALPEGDMINYLSRHVDPLPDLGTDEAVYVRKMAQTPPDYVIVLSRDLREYGVNAFGAEGNQGYLIFQWLRANYTTEARSQGAIFLRHKDNLKHQTLAPPPQHN